MKIYLIQILINILLISLLTLDSYIASAEQERVWECYQNSCEVPNQYQIKSKNHEVEEDGEFRLRIQKTMANETKKFPQYGRQNKTILELDKRKHGNFSAFSFPNSGN